MTAIVATIGNATPRVTHGLQSHSRTTQFRSFYGTNWLKPLNAVSAVWRRYVVVTLMLLVFQSVLAGDTLDASSPTEKLPAGDFVWTPQLAPRGPVLIVVSLLEQQAYVYRNGVRIATSSVSTGKSGYETPTGVFTILQKRREHYSNVYDNAPMPYMQRLTWDGIALHAGRVPGYPASHGCIRLPYAFSEKLFGITTHGMTVVVTASIAGTAVRSKPELFSTRDVSANVEGALAPAMPDAPWTWQPQRSPTGPLSLLLSTQDQQIIVLRNGIEIGRAAIKLEDTPSDGTYVYTLLEGSRPEPSPVVANRPALSWLRVQISDIPVPASDPVRDAIASGRLIVPQAFAQLVYDALAPGATLIVTDEPPGGGALLAPRTLFEASEPVGTQRLEPGD